MTDFSQRYSLQTGGFVEWLEKQVAELNQADYYLSQTATVSVPHLEKRNLLLSDINRRCALWHSSNETECQQVSEVVAAIRNPFLIDAQKQCCSAVFPFAKLDVDSPNRRLNLIAPTSSDRLRASQIQSHMDDLYRLEVERWRIKVLTLLGMTTLVVMSVSISISCPVATVAMLPLAIAGCYYLQAHCQKACRVVADKVSDVPLALRSDKPSQSFMSVIPPQASFIDWVLPKSSQYRRVST